MKRTALTLVFLLTAFLAMASDVTPERAGKLASSFFSGTRGAAHVDLVWDGTDGLTRSGESPAFYVFNHAGGGFVVVAGDDAATPILAFSQTGKFMTEGMPEQIRSFFREYTREITYLRNTGRKQTAEGAALWERAAREGIARYTAIKELHTPTWGQSAPFNDLCPVVDGGRSVAGCVAVAISEVMYHHRWPGTTAEDRLPDYNYKTDKGNNQIITGHNLAASYDWSLIKSSYAGSATTESRAEVAKLVHDVGVMMQSSYNPTGTGAFSDDIPEAMVHYMNYDSSTVLYYREEFSTERWCSMLRNEIDNNRPVLYGGDGAGGGHQFVVDGYATDDYFAMNWGWSGSDNGFYKISSFMTSMSYDFRAYGSAVFNLKPNAGGKAIDLLRFYVTYKGTDYYGGMSLSSGTIAKGNTVKFTVANLGNDGFATVNGQLALALADYKGNIKTTYGAEDFTLEQGYGVSGEFTITINEDLALGDKFILVYKTATVTEWTPVSYDPYYTTFIVDNVPAFDYPAIYFDASKSYHAGDVFDLRLINTSRAPSSIAWFYDYEKIADDVYDVELTAGKHTIRAEVNIGSGSQTLYQVINVQ